MNTTSGAQQSGERVRASLTAAMGYGGWQATILSGFALLISAYSLYESTFKTADIEVYIPPVIQYARDSGGDTELFALPITVTNSGARYLQISRGKRCTDKFANVCGDGVSHRETPD